MESPYISSWRRQWHPTPVLLPGKSSTNGCSFFYVSLCIYLGVQSGASGLQHGWAAGYHFLSTPVSSSKQATRLSRDIKSNRARLVCHPVRSDRLDGSTLAKASSVYPRSPNTSTLPSLYHGHSGHCDPRGQGAVNGDPEEDDLSLMDSTCPLCSSSTPGSALDPYSSCNKNCECQTDSFTPVCGADGITYLSACFAGCNSTVLLIF